MLVCHSSELWKILTNRQESIIERTRLFHCMIPCFTMLKNRRSPSYSGTMNADFSHISITNSVTISSIVEHPISHAFILLLARLLRYSDRIRSVSVSGKSLPNELTVEHLARCFIVALYLGRVRRSNFMVTWWKVVPFSAGDTVEWVDWLKRESDVEKTRYGTVVEKQTWVGNFEWVAENSRWLNVAEVVLATSSEGFLVQTRNINDLTRLRTTTGNTEYKHSLTLRIRAILS